MSQFPSILQPTEADITKMLACQVHLGTRNLDHAMKRYVWKRRSDGFYVINLQKTWEKLLLAARVLVTVDNAADVCVISARPWGQRAVLKFAKYTGATAVSGRFTPGTFTNQIQKAFIEPRILVLTDPRTDSQPIREASYVNVPTIAFAHTDSPLRHVDIAIPANNKAKHSIGLLWWMLAREVIRLRSAAVDRTVPWDVMVDMFFYRDPDEQERQEAEAAAAAAAAIATQQQQAAALTAPQATAFDPIAAEASFAGAPGQEWGVSGAADVTWDSSNPGEWGAQPDAAAPVAAAPGAGAATPTAGAPGASWDATPSWDQ